MACYAYMWLHVVLEEMMIVQLSNAIVFILCAIRAMVVDSRVVFLMKVCLMVFRYPTYKGVDMLFFAWFIHIGFSCLFLVSL